MMKPPPALGALAHRSAMHLASTIAATGEVPNVSPANAAATAQEMAVHVEIVRAFIHALSDVFPRGQDDMTSSRQDGGG